MKQLFEIFQKYQNILKYTEMFKNKPKNKT